MKYSDDNNKKNNHITLPMVFLLSITLLGYECKKRPHGAHGNPSNTVADTSNASADQPAVANTNAIVTNELVDEVRDKIMEHSQALSYSNPTEIIQSFQLLIEVLTDLNNNKTATLNIRKTPNKQASALHLAVRLGHLATVKALVDCGADINAVNMHNETPLYYAAQEMGNIREMGIHEDIIAYLVKLGADKSIATTAENKPKTPHAVVVEFIKTYKKDPKRKKRLVEVEPFLKS